MRTFKTGEKSRDVMSIGDVEKIRSKSRAKNGPWSDPIFYPEMAKKTVARRHSKVLPLSTDLDDLIRRDDDLYDLKGAREDADAAAVAAGRPRTLAGRLDLIANKPDLPNEEGGDQDTEDQTAGTVIDDAPSTQGDEPTSSDDASLFSGAGAAPGPEGDRPPHTDNDGDALQTAFKRGREAQMTGVPRKSPPGEYRAADREDELTSWQRGWDASAGVDAEG